MLDRRGFLLRSLAAGLGGGSFLAAWSELDGAPTAALEELRAEGTSRARDAAAFHLGARPEEIVLTRSTTEGLALVYHGLRLEPGEEVLTTEHDHYATHGSLRLAAERAGASVRRIPLYERPESATADEMVSRSRRLSAPRRGSWRSPGSTPTRGRSSPWSGWPRS